MSRFTTEVRWICDFYSGMDEQGEYTDVDERIENASEHIFEEYPIFDETYRGLLNKKILRHYYTREICEETVGLWKLRLNNRMNEIMPYYNKLYESELLTFNPFYDVDLKTVQDRNSQTQGEKNYENSDIRNGTKNESGTRTGESEEKDNRVRNESFESEREKNSNAENAGNRVSVDEMSGNREDNKNSTENLTGNESGTNKNIDKYSDTPQGAITGLENGTYLTNARIVDGENNRINNQSNNAKENGNSEYEESKQSNESNSERSKADENETLSHQNINNESGNRKNSENIEDSRNTIENNSGKTKGNEDSSVNSIEAYAEKVSGKRGYASYSKMLQEFRETFLNIDKMIIDDLSDLFFGLWE